MSNSNDDDDGVLVMIMSMIKMMIDEDKHIEDEYDDVGMLIINIIILKMMRMG